jgi:SAM-dependent methyltransferase
MTSPVHPTTPNTWQADRYVREAAFVPALARDLVDWLAARPGERVLDLGCGDGTLTGAIQAAGAAVVGIDASASMVDAARARGIDARAGAAESLPFAGEFDAVFSNAMLHWTRDIDRVLAGVARALAPGGRFVGEFGGAGNIAGFLALVADVMAAQGYAFRQPWYFPTEDAFADALIRAGFTPARIVRFARPTALPGTLGGWLEVFGGPLLEGVPAAGRPALVAAIEAAAAPTRRRGDVWELDYVRLRFDARICDRNRVS